MDPMEISAYALAMALSFRGIYEVERGERVISADTAVRLGRYFGLPAQFWLNLRNDYDLRIAEGSGEGKGIRPRSANHRAEQSTDASACRRDYGGIAYSRPNSFHFLFTSALVFSSIRISSGQGRLKPSLAHLRVASMPIFEP